MEEWLTPNEFEERIGKHGQTIRRWCKLGLLRHRRDGRDIRIPASEIGREIRLGQPATVSPEEADRIFLRQVEPVARVPLYESAGAGAGEHFDGDHAEGWVQVPESIAKEGVFAVRALGESMAPTILDRDIVVFQRLEVGWPAKNRIVLAVLEGGDSVIKRYATQPQRLCSDNVDRSSYPDIPIERVARIYGVGVRVMREL